MSVVPWEILSNEIVLRRACASAQASFRHFSDKFSSVCGTDASSLTMYATDTALVRLRGETICLPEPLLALSSNAKESCHKLPADTRTGSFLFESRRLIRLRSVVYIIYFAFVPQLKLKACHLVGTTSNSNITAPLIKVDPISYHIHSQSSSPFDPPTSALPCSARWCYEDIHLYSRMTSAAGPSKSFLSSMRSTSLRHLSKTKFSQSQCSVNRAPLALRWWRSCGCLTNRPHGLTFQMTECAAFNLYGTREFRWYFFFLFF